MQAIPLILCVAIFIFLSATTYSTANCPIEATSVSVKGETDIPSIVHSYSRNQIAAISGGISLPGFSIQGLTEVNLETDLELSFSLTNDGGGWCANVSRVSLTLGYSNPPTIYLAKELKPGSCQYETVLEHEQLHVSIANKNVWQGVSLLKEHLLQETLYFTPSLKPTKAEAYEHTKEMFNQFVAQAFNRVTQKAKQENAEIDTPASYKAMSRRCQEL